ncbi:hypothetical protein GC194_01850 [bacterium]|nr:hypothetical protein [bacterium]
MNTYKLIPDAFLAISKKIKINSISINFIALLGAAALLFFKSESDETTLTVLPLALIPGSIIFWFRLPKIINQQKEKWMSYELHINEDTITRKQRGLPDVNIMKSELHSIETSPNGNLLLKTARKNHFIIIPAGIANRQEMMADLKNFTDLEPSLKKNNPFIIAVAVAVVVVILLTLLFTSSSLTMSLTLSLLITGILIWSFIKIQLSNEIDKKTKKKAYIVFMLIVAIFFKVIETLPVDMP